MFNFTGNTRRPRQVNLSGKPTSGSPASSSRHSARISLATSARESRAQREAERLRLRAITKIQSLARGRLARIQFRAKLRREWDEHESTTTRATRDGTPTRDYTDRLAMLLAFWTINEPQDQDRLCKLISSYIQGDFRYLSRHDLERNARLSSLTKRLTVAVVSLLSYIEPDMIESSSSINDILQYLTHISSVCPEVVRVGYYQALSRITISLSSDTSQALGTQKSYPPTRNMEGHSLSKAILSPLMKADSEFLSANCSLFVYEFLTVPQVLERFAAITDQNLLLQSVPLHKIIKSILRLDLLELPVDNTFWLLAHIIYLQQQRQQLTSHGTNVWKSVGAVNKEEFLEFASCLSWLFGIVSQEIASHWSLVGDDVEGDVSASIPTDFHAKLSSRSRKAPLAKFISDQLQSILSPTFVQRLFSTSIGKSPLESQSNSQDLNCRGGEPRVLAHLCLMLLQAFPSTRSNLRKWLYLARTNDGQPVLKYFWNFLKQCSTFKASTNMITVMEQALCRSYLDNGSSMVGNDWTVTFLFFELLSFAFVVMDDEEFFSGQGMAFELSDLCKISVFLKNLAFVSFWFVQRIEHAEAASTDAGTSESSKIQRSTRNDIAGVRGINLPWVRVITVRLLRMLYGRDSRQKFVPDTHWLMTKEVGMDGFIPAVVAEEERRHKDELESKDRDDSDDGTDEDLEEEEGASSRDRYTPHRRPGLQISDRNGRRSVHENYLAAITPRLEILQNLPFFFPFRTRVEIFREFVTADQHRRRNGYVDPDSWRLAMNERHTFEPNFGGAIAKHHGRISRKNLFEDAFSEFYALGDGLKEPIQITFIDSFGAEEAGIDGGGVTKEFLTSISKEAFNGNLATETANEFNDPYSVFIRKLFIETDEHLLHPNPLILEELKLGYQETSLPEADKRAACEEDVNEILKRYEFLGRIIGKCLYEAILVDVAFAGFFLLKWSKATASTDDFGLGVDDLKALDHGLWKGLQALKQYDAQTMETLCLSFSTEAVITPPPIGVVLSTKSKVVSFDLKPNGSMIPVTTTNRLEYIHLLARYHLVLQARLQTHAFVTGLSTMISPRWLSMFNQSELQTLVGGNDSSIDIDDLRSNTMYGGVYAVGDDGLEHPTVAFFWKVMRSLSDTDRKEVIRFVTSVSRAPLLGFTALQPRFSIRDGGSDEERLPSSSTCVNLLKLPRYNSEGVLREKLLYAVRAGAGFDLS